MVGETSNEWGIEVAEYGCGRVETYTRLRRTMRAKSKRSK